MFWNGCSTPSDSFASPSRIRRTKQVSPLINDLIRCSSPTSNRDPPTKCVTEHLSLDSISASSHFGMQIVHYPHPALRYKSVDVRQIDGTLRKTIGKMFDLMYEANGIGLAANQVALPFRFFIMNLAGRPDEADEEFVFINPVIKKRKGNVTGEEGCLSLPGLYADVVRSEEVVIEAFDLQGQGFSMELTELAARVVQHELDHLDGVLFTDKLADPEKKDEVGAELARFVSRFEAAQATELLPESHQLDKEVAEVAGSGTIPADFPDRPRIDFPPASEEES